MPDKAAGPLKIFISYAHEDDKLCQEFLKNLAQLEREGLIEHWTDRKIAGGDDWAGKIDDNLNAADIILLLVSPDFLASEYCNDVEMTRALERHNEGTARVIPVILRPSDWRASRFSKLEALPKDGKPVVDWKTRDHGLLNVVEGLRRIATRAADKTESPRRPFVFPFRKARSRRIGRWQFAAAAVVLVLTAGWFWWSRQRQYLSLGNDFLDVARYSEARGPFEQALKLNPFSAKAKLGLRKVELADLRPDAVAFERRLNQLLKESPKDPHLRVFQGDYLLGAQQPGEAMKRYQEAASMNPRLAEAYFRMGVLFDQGGDSIRAFRMYQRAAELGKYSPHYLANLGDQYFKRGEYDEALSEYGRTSRFPLAALESAKIHRLIEGHLTQARELEIEAIRWLEDQSVANQPENRWPWYFQISQTKGVRLVNRDEKLCYASLSLSATLYLKKEDPQAVDRWKRAIQTCGARLSDVQAILDWELARVADLRQELSDRVQSYRGKYLAE